MIVDEPTLGLAPVIIKTMAGMFDKLLHLGLTLVIAEQNADFALKVAGRGVVISNGQISFQGGVDVLSQGGALRRAYLGGYTKTL